MNTLETTLALYETGVEIMRQNLRRADPEAHEATIEQRLVEWLRHRPGAEHGDGVGTPRHSLRVTP